VSNQECEMKNCSSCEEQFCIVHGPSVISLITQYKPTNFSAHEYFCSGICLSRWNLVMIEKNSQFFGMLDPSWYPVIKNLSSQLNIYGNKE